MWTVDFETQAITPTDCFPTPVGVAYRTPAGEIGYREGKSMAALVRSVAASKEPTLFHNGVGFDLGVMEKHFHRTIPAPLVEDTLVAAALLDPYGSVGLKPLSARLLGMKNDDTKPLESWIRANVPDAANKSVNWGAYIALAPRALREPYAKADVERTYKLHRKLLPAIKREKMLGAYRREIAAAPLLRSNSVAGIRVDVAALRHDVPVWQHALDRVDNHIRRELRAPRLDVDSNEALADAIEALGVKLPLTEKGARQTNKDALALALAAQPKASRLLRVRGVAATYLRSFMRPWLDMATRRGDGTISTHWNSVRGSGAGGGGGAKTGRLSSEPNLQNIPSPDKREDLLTTLGLREDDLPNPRRYILPDPGEELIGGDFSQQELRILAHFEGGDLLEMYRRFPDLDLHDYVRLMIKEVSGRDLPRKLVKVLNFCIIYGGGAPAVSAQGGISYAEAKEALDLYKVSLPSVWSMRYAYREGVRTAGGRIVLPQSSDLVYRLLNYLIQGSAADQMKELLISLRDMRAGRFLLTVHDEIVLSAPKAERSRVVAELRERMLATVGALKIETPFKVDLYTGPNWADVKKEVA